MSGVLLCYTMCVGVLHKMVVMCVYCLLVSVCFFINVGKFN